MDAKKKSDLEDPHKRNSSFDYPFLEEEDDLGICQLTDSDPLPAAPAALSDASL